MSNTITGGGSREVVPQSLEQELLDLHNSATGKNVRSEAAEPGNSLKQERAAQRGISGLQSLEDDVGDEVAEVIAGVIGKDRCGSVPILLTAVEAGLNISKLSMAIVEHARAEGLSLSDAGNRDAIRALLLNAIANHLPPEYVTHERGSMPRGVSAVPRMVLGMTNSFEDQAALKRFIGKAVESAVAGRQEARDSGITTREALVNRMASDPNFAEAYKTNSAFRHGVDSVIFEKEHVAQGWTVHKPPVEAAARKAAEELAEQREASGLSPDEAGAPNPNLRARRR